MTITLLLDLDDTLLNSNLDALISGYFKSLSNFMSHKVAPEKFLRALMSSTQKMYSNKEAGKTIEQVFSHYFYPEIGYTFEELADDLEHYYDEVFPTLSHLTAPKPDAVEFVDWAISKGFDVAIATDPLFPRKAILHRLRWAGLPPEKYPFTLISDFQHFHFVKKTVAFFPEFLAKIHWIDSPIIMIGDSLDRDIEPSKKAGIPVFWLNDQLRGFQDGVPCGGFRELKEFLETTDYDRFSVNLKLPSALIAFLRATPAVFHNLLRAGDMKSLSTRSSLEQWSFIEVLCHVRDVDIDVNLVRIATILGEDNAFIQGQYTDQWVEERDYIHQDPQMAFQQLVQAREKLVNLLENIPAALWERRARHALLGPTSLFELVGIIVDHDRLHIQQAQIALMEKKVE